MLIFKKLFNSKQKFRFRFLFFLTLSLFTLIIHCSGENGKLVTKRKTTLQVQNAFEKNKSKVPNINYNYIEEFINKVNSEDRLFYLEAENFRNDITPFLKHKFKGFEFTSLKKDTIYSQWEEANLVKEKNKFDFVGLKLEGYRVARKGQKYALLNSDGKAITDFEYDQMSIPSEGLIASFKDNKWGYINFKGETKIPFKYDEVTYFSQGVARVSIGEDRYFINYKGAKIKDNGEIKWYEGDISHISTKLNGFHADLIFSGNSAKSLKAMLLPSDILKVNPNKFTKLNNGIICYDSRLFFDVKLRLVGIAYPYLEDKSIFIPEERKENADFALHYNGDIFKAKEINNFKDKSFTYISLKNDSSLLEIFKNKHVSTRINKLENKFGIYLLKKNKKLAIVDYQQEQKTNFEFDKISAMLGYIDSYFSDSDIHLLMTVKDGKTGIYSGHIELVPPIFDKVDILSNRYFFGTKDGKDNIYKLNVPNLKFTSMIDYLSYSWWQLTADSGESVLRNSYDEIKWNDDFNHFRLISNNRMAILDSDFENENSLKWQMPYQGFLTEGRRMVAYDKTMNSKVFGYVNKNDSLVIPFKFMFAAEFSDGVAKVKDQNGKYGVIDTLGNYVIQPEFDWMDNLRDGFYKVKNNDLYGYINTKGDIILDTRCDEGIELNRYGYFKDYRESRKYGNRLTYYDSKGQYLITIKNMELVNEYNEHLVCLEKRKNLFTGDDVIVHYFNLKNGKKITYDKALENYSGGYNYIQYGFLILPIGTVEKKDDNIFRPKDIITKYKIIDLNNNVAREVNKKFARMTTKGNGYFETVLRKNNPDSFSGYEKIYGLYDFISDTYKTYPEVSDEYGFSYLGNGKFSADTKNDKKKIFKPFNYIESHSSLPSYYSRVNNYKSDSDDTIPKSNMKIFRAIDKKEGIKDKNGKTIFPAIYNDIKVSDFGIAIASYDVKGTYDREYYILHENGEKYKSNHNLYSGELVKRNYSLYGYNLSYIMSDKDQFIFNFPYEITNSYNDKFIYRYDGVNYSLTP